MPKRRSKTKPTFLWQGLLIVLPVIVLAAVGFFSLRQDKAMAGHEAAERAQVIAEDLLPKVSNAITPNPNAADLVVQCFGVDESGELIFPPAYSPVPVPQPLRVNELSQEQTQLWNELWTADVGSRHDLIRRFVESSPPTNFAAAACYRQGLLLADQGDPRRAAEMFFEVFQRYHDAAGESGLPLRPLAALKLLQLRARASDWVFTNSALSVESYCLEAIFFPTSLTPWLLQQVQSQVDEVKVRKFQQLWARHELMRQIFAAARRQGSIGGAPAPTPTMVQGADDPIRAAATNQLLSARSIAPGKQPAEELFYVRLEQPWEGSDNKLLTTNFVRPFYSLPPEAPNWVVLHYDAAEQAVLQSESYERALGDWLRREYPGYRSTTDMQQQLNELRGRMKVPPSVINSVPPPGLKQNVFQNFPSAATNLRPHNGRTLTRPRPETVLKSRLFIKTYPTRNRNVFQLAWNREWEPSDLGDIATNHWFVCRAESEIGELVSHLVKNQRQIPEYFGIGVEIAGCAVRRGAPDLREWHYQHYAGKPGGIKREISTALTTNVLASATDGLLRVNVYLTSPSALFRRQSARTFWFSSLIAVSALAALIGLATAWRAFQHQLQLNELKSNFVSSVSHELRAPIASVRLLAESLERGKIQETQKQSEYFRFIGQECRRLSSLIENVLDFSRIDQGRKQYEFEPTDVVALLQQTVKLMEPYAAERQVKLSLSLPGSDAAPNRTEASLDGKAMQQALVNLIDNAIKHSSKGDTVTVGLDWVQDGSAAGARPLGGQLAAKALPKQLRLWVEDQGEGIPPDEHERIFERFYRCGSELRRQTQGVGIGLSIVQHIVEAHGGQVLVRSALGQGSRFTIELPVNNATES